MIAGNEKKMEGIEFCFYCYPRFFDDYPLLLEEGVVEKLGYDDYRWNYSKSSLAQYFLFISGHGPHSGPINRRTNMDWALLEHVFKMKKGSLRRVASSNGNTYKLDNPEWKSRDFKKILSIIPEIET
jgi:hypothetical protein